MFQQMFFGTNRTLYKIAAAIRAGVVEPVLRTVGAKGAFKRAHSGVTRRRRQVFITTFAVWFEQQHDTPLCLFSDRLAIFRMA